MQKKCVLADGSYLLLVPPLSQPMTLIRRLRRLDWRDRLSQLSYVHEEDGPWKLRMRKLLRLLRRLVVGGSWPSLTEKLRI